MDARYYNGDDDREQSCSEDADTCPCPGCVAWRDLRDADDLRARLEAEEAKP
jgi:hypothetical protein